MFVSLMLRKRFFGAMGELDCPLDLEIADDRFILVARVIGVVLSSYSASSIRLIWFPFFCVETKL